MKKIAEKRSSERFDVDISGQYKSIKKIELANELLVENISLGGAKLSVANKNLRKGDTIVVLIGMDETSCCPIIALAEIRWISKDQKIGVKFNQLDNTSLSCITKILKNCVKG